MKEIGVPSVSGMTSALKAGAIGAVGGAIVGLSNKFFGTGMWGALAGIAAAGSILKGDEGKIISTVLGFQIGQQIVGGFTGTKVSGNVASVYTVV